MTEKITTSNSEVFAEAASAINHEKANEIRLFAAWKPAMAPSLTVGNLKVGIADVANRDDNSITGMLVQSDIDPSVTFGFVEYAEIENEFQHRGIGSRMYKGFTRLAQEHGATHLVGAPSLRAYAVRGRIFEPSRIKYYEGDIEDFDANYNGNNEITAEEFSRRLAARDRRDRFYDSLTEKYGSDIDTRLASMTDREKMISRHLASQNCIYTVAIDLRGLATAEWEPGLIENS